MLKFKFSGIAALKLGKACMGIQSQADFEMQATNF